MEDFIEVAKVFVEPAIKLVDTVARGCGILYEPTRKRRLATASAFEISTVATAIRENYDLPISYNNGVVQIDSTETKEIAERAIKRMLLQEMRKQQNIEAIVDKAYEELKDDTVVSNEPVDDDWLVRFFNSVEDVSNEVVQNIWSRVLAGEIKRPSTFSLRTLETLKNLSQYEAELFQRYSSFVMRSEAICFLPVEPELDAEYTITNKDIKLLDDAGLLKSQGQGLMLKMNELPRKIRNEQIVGLFDIRSDPNAVPTLTSFFLTNAGGELYEAIRSISVESEEYAIKYLRLLKHKQNYLKISAHRIAKISGDHVEYENDDLI